MLLHAGTVPGLRQSILKYFPKLAQSENGYILRTSRNSNHRLIWNKSTYTQTAQLSTFSFNLSSSFANIKLRNHMPVPSPIGGCSCTRSYGRYEPDYLDATGPQIALYEVLDFQLTGYDYPVLEQFGKFVHKTAERMGFEVEDAWATPCKHFKITRLKPESTIADAEYKLQVYERNVQLVEVPATSLPLLLDVLQTALPAGVKLKVYPHFNIHDEIRYVPDLQLKELKKELEVRSTGGTVVTEKKKK